MEIKVTEEDLIQNIQRSFHEQYPYLKLHFYKNPHKVGEVSPKADQLDAATPIEEAAMFHTSGKVDIGPERTVAEVEADFFHKLGLCVQVMRQSGDIWIATAGTDWWTLQRQNDKGHEHSRPAANEQPDDADMPDVD